MENEITELVQKAMQLLREFRLTEGAQKSYYSRSFRPIIDYYQTSGTKEFQNFLMLNLETLYQAHFKNGFISRTTFNWRIRGLSIMSEIHATGNYEWKVYSHKKTIELPKIFECLVNDFGSKLDLLIRKNKTHNERLIPMAHDVAEICKNYINKVSMIYLDTE